MSAYTGPLRQESPFNFFRLRALELAPKLGVDLAFATEAVGILATVFGEQWLNRAARDFSSSAAIAFRQHPLGDMISTAGETQIADAFELVQYLIRVRDVPRLNDVVEGLKKYYHSALLQLSTGARLSIAGASQLEFEPPALANRASDIRCRAGEVQLVVECYRTTRSKPEQDGHIRLAFDVLELASKTDHVLSIAISLRVTLGPDVRKNIESLVAKAIADCVTRIGLGHHQFPSTMLSDEFAVVSVTRTLPSEPGSPPVLLRPHGFPEQGDDWTIFSRTIRGPKEILTNVGPAGPPDPSRSNVGIWLKPDDRPPSKAAIDPNAVARLGRKIEAKLAQTRSIGAPTRVVVVQTPMTAGLITGPQTARDRLVGKIVTSHLDVAGLVLVQRSWQPELGRHGYRVLPLMKVNVAPEVSKLISHFAELR